MRRVLSVWKVLLLIFASFAVAGGGTALVLFMKGDFNEKIVKPVDMDFSHSVDGQGYYNNGLSRFELSGDGCKLTIVCTNEGVTEKNIKLSLLDGITKDGYVSDGVIKVPSVVQLNTPFAVQLVREYNVELEQNWVNGGISRLTADPYDANIELSKKSVTIAVDTPVHSIEANLKDFVQETEIKQVVVGSEFSVETTFTPEESESFYQDDSRKKGVYYSWSRDVSYDESTQKFTANNETEGSSYSTIYAYAFATSYFEQNYFATHENAAMNEIVEFLSNTPTQAVSDEIKIQVVSVDVDSVDFTLNNATIQTYVDKNFVLTANSNNGDRTLGMTIKDSQDNVLNGLFGKVGIKIPKGVGGLSIRGGRVVRVAGSSISVEDFNPETDYFNPAEGVAYYLLPDTRPASANDYFWQIAASEELEDVPLKVNFFYENEGATKAFLSAENEGEILLTTEIHSDEAVGWKSESDQSMLITYDQDGNARPDSVRLSGLINAVNSDNVYKTIKYFLLVDGDNSALKVAELFDVKTGVEYTSANNYSGENITISGVDAAAKYTLYEIEGQNLTALKGFTGSVKLIAVIVRTDADGRVYRATNNGYIFVTISTTKNIFVRSTLAISSLTPKFSLGADAYEIGGVKYVPSVKKDKETQEDKVLIAFELTLESDDLVSDTQRVLDAYADERKLLDVVCLDESGAVAETQYVELISLEEDTDSKTGATTKFDGVLKINADLINATNASTGLYVKLQLRHTDATRNETFTKDVENAASEGANYFYIYYQVPTSMSGEYEKPENNRSAYEEISVTISQDSTIILWGESGVDGLSELNNLLKFEITDQKGNKLDVDDGEYRFYFVEEVKVGEQYSDRTNGRLLIFNNDATKIAGFSPTNGAELTTYLTVYVLDSTGSRKIASNRFTFIIKSEGLTNVEYDSSTDINTHTMATGNLGEITIRKYVDAGSVISFEKDGGATNELFKVYVSDVETTNYSVVLDTTFVSTRFSTASSKDLMKMLSFNDIAKSEGQGDELSYYLKERVDGNVTQNALGIEKITIQAPFGVNTTLEFNIVSDNGLFSIKLNLILLSDISCSNNFSEFADTYADYLRPASGNDYSNAISVFAENSYDLDYYMPFENTEKYSWIKAFQGVTTGLFEENSGLIAQDSTNKNKINISSVYEDTIVSFTAYYKVNSSFAFSATCTLCINPNIAIVQTDEDNFVDLNEIDEDECVIGKYYNAYKLLDYLTSGGVTKNNITGSGAVTYGNDSPAQQRYLSISATNGEFSLAEGTLNYQFGQSYSQSFKLIRTEGGVQTTIDGVVINNDGTIVKATKGQTRFSLNIGFGSDSPCEMIADIISGVRVVEYNGEPTPIFLIGHGGYPLTGFSAAILSQNSKLTFVIVNSTPTITVSGSMDGAFFLDNERIRLSWSKDVGKNVHFIINIEINAIVTKIGDIFVNYDGIGEDVDFATLLGNYKALETANIYQELDSGATYELLNVEYIKTQDEVVDLSKTYYINSGEYSAIGTIYAKTSTEAEYRVAVEADITAADTTLYYKVDKEYTAIDMQKLYEQNSNSGFHYEYERANSSGTLQTTMELVTENVQGYRAGVATLNGTKLTLANVENSLDNVYVVVKFTALAIGQNYSYSWYYRIKVKPTYTKGQAIYPYADDVEYLDEMSRYYDATNSTYTIDFAETFKEGTSTPKEERYNKNRFASGTGVAATTSEIFVSSVKVKTGTMADFVEMADYSAYLQITFAGSKANIRLINTTAKYEIVFGQRQFSNGQAIVGSEIYYTIKINQSTDYSSEVYLYVKAESPTPGVSKYYEWSGSAYAAVEDAYKKTTDTNVDANKTYYTESGSVYTAVESPTNADIGNYYEFKAGLYRLERLSKIGGIYRPEIVANGEWTEFDTILRIGVGNQGSKVTNYSYYSVGDEAFVESGTISFNIENERLIFQKKDNIAKEGTFEIGYYTDEKIAIRIIVSVKSTYQVVQNAAQLSSGAERNFADVFEARYRESQEGVSETTTLSLVNGEDDLYPDVTYYEYGYAKYNGEGYDETATYYIYDEENTEYIELHEYEPLAGMFESLSSKPRPLSDWFDGEIFFVHYDFNDYRDKLYYNWGARIVSERYEAGKTYFILNEGNFEPAQRLLIRDVMTIDNENNKINVAYLDHDVTARFKVTIDESFEYEFDVTFTATNPYTQTTLDATGVQGRLSSVPFYVGISDLGSILRSSEAYEFVGGTQTCSIIPTETGNENGEEMTQTLNLVYKFGGKKISTFAITYRYVAVPNVEVTINYPKPDGENATDVEYVKSGTTITLGGEAPFALAERVAADRKTGFDGAKDIRVSIDTENSYGVSVSVSPSGSNPLEWARTLTLSGATSGYVTFVIEVNSVVRYYRVNVVATDIVQWEAHAPNYADNHEVIYAEDLATYQSQDLFEKNRILSLQFNSNATLNATYYVKLVKGSSIRKVDVVATTRNADINIDLGGDYSGYEYAGTYTAYNALGGGFLGSSVSNIYTKDPFITNRIAFRYGTSDGRPLTVATAVVHRDGVDGEEFTGLTAADFESADDTTLYINYKVGEDETATTATYNISTEVEFVVERNNDNYGDTFTYQTIQAGTTANLLRDYASAFGIKNMRKGTNGLAYDSTMMAESAGEFSLHLYGFAGYEVGGADTELGKYHQNLDITPRANGYEINTDYDNTDPTYNYITISGQRPNGKEIEYILQARGASNDGDYVMMRIDYSVTFGSVTFGLETYTESHNILFKVEPNSTIYFRNGSGAGLLVAVPETFEGIVYAANMSNPIVVKDGDALNGSNGWNERYLYDNNNEHTPDLIAHMYGNSGSGGNNADRFKYKHSSRSVSLSEDRFYNDYAASLEYQNEYNKTSNRFFMQKLKLGVRYFFVDAIDRFNYRVRIFYQLNGEITPGITLSNSTLAEGSTLAFGAAYSVVDVETETINSKEYVIYDRLVCGETSDSLKWGNIGSLTGLQNKDIAIIDNHSYTKTGDTYSGRIYAEYNGSDWNGGWKVDGDTGYDAISDDSVAGTETIKLGRNFNSSSETVKMGTEITLTVGSTTYTLIPRYTGGTATAPATGDASNTTLATLSGFKAYGFESTGLEISPTAAEGFKSNFTNITVTKVEFYKNGILIGDTGPISKSLATSAGYKFDKGTTALVSGGNVNASENSENAVKVPVVNSYYYGTGSTISGVIMKVHIKDGANNKGTLTQTISLTHQQKNGIFNSDVTDGNAISTPEGVNETIYNDTLEVILQPGEEVSFKYQIRSETLDKTAHREKTYYTKSGSDYTAVAPTLVEFKTGTTYYKQSGGSYSEVGEDEKPIAGTIYYTKLGETYTSVSPTIVVFASGTTYYEDFTSDVIELSNNRIYAVTEYVPITRKINGIGRNLDADDVVSIVDKSGDNVTFRYNGGSVTNTIKIKTLIPANVILHINDQNELASLTATSNKKQKLYFLYVDEHESYVQTTDATPAGGKTYYTESGGEYTAVPAPATFTSGTTYYEKETDTYQYEQEFSIYPNYYKIESTSTDTQGNIVIVVEKYYKSESAYYIIPRASWASAVTVKAANDDTTQTLGTAAPYMFNFKINDDAAGAGSAFIDENGTITTSTDFDLESNTITLNVYMKVSGYDGEFERDSNLRLGQVTLSLKKYQTLDSIIYKHINTTTGVGNAAGFGELFIFTGENNYRSSDASAYLHGMNSTAATGFGEFVAQAGVEVNLKTLFDELDKNKNDHNTHYHLVKDNDAYIAADNLDKWTFDTAGEHNVVIAKSYKNGTSGNILFAAYEAKFYVYNAADTQEKEIYLNLAGKIFYEVSYVKTTDTAIAPAKTYYTKSSGTYTAVADPQVANIGDYYEVSYVATTDASPVAGKTYYKKDGSNYTACEDTDYVISYSYEENHQKYDGNNLISGGETFIASGKYVRAVINKADCRYVRYTFYVSQQENQDLEVGKTQNGAWDLSNLNDLPTGHAQDAIRKVYDVTFDGSQITNKTEKSTETTSSGGTKTYLVEYANGKYERFSVKFYIIANSATNFYEYGLRYATNSSIIASFKAANNIETLVGDITIKEIAPNGKLTSFVGSDDYVVNKTCVIVYNNANYRYTYRFYNYKAEKRINFETTENVEFALSNLSEEVKLAVGCVQSHESLEDFEGGTTYYEWSHDTYEKTEDSTPDISKTYYTTKNDGVSYHRLNKETGVLSDCTQISLETIPSGGVDEEFYVKVGDDYYLITFHFTKQA